MSQSSRQSASQDRVVFRDYVGGIDFFFETRDLSMTGCQAIVNPTGAHLDNSGAVSENLVKSFPQLKDECEAHVRDSGPLEPEEVVTFRFRNPTGIIINVVSPNKYKYSDEDEAGVVLSNVIFNAIKEGHLQKCESIAIPTIGIGNSGLSYKVGALSYWNAMKRCSSQHGVDLSNLRRVCFANISSNTMLRLKEHLDVFANKAKSEPVLASSNENPFAPVEDVMFCQKPGCGKAMKPEQVVDLPDEMVFCKSCLKSILKQAKETTVPYIEQPEGRCIGPRYINNKDLPNFKGTGTIELCFQIPAGFHSLGHPYAGAPYLPVDLKAYLPNNDKGKQLRDKLKEAFISRKLFKFTWSLSIGRKSLLVPRVTLLEDKTDSKKSWTWDSMKNLEKQLNELLK